MRDRRIEQLKEILAAFETGTYQTDSGTAHVRLSEEQIFQAEVFLPGRIAYLTPENTVTEKNGHCVFSCRNTDSYAMAMEMLENNPDEPVLVLNLANPVNPGGGVRRGAAAQEEDLCRKSSLLLNLEGEQALPYYAYNRSLNTYMGSDALIISPYVEIIRDPSGRLFSPSVIVSVMTCAAPMIRYGLEGMTKEEYRHMLYRRIEGMLKCAAAKGYRRLVLGAFGCGAFANDAADVAPVFKEVFDRFDFGGRTDELFDEIVFAVLCTRDLYNFDIFSEYFGG